MNVALLKKIRARILRHPSKFRMDVYTCGTAHCIGGWACVLAGKTLDPLTNETTNGGQPWNVAGAILRLKPAQRNRLFHQWEWPEQFQEKYHAAKRRDRRARIAAARIDHFIATNGAE